MTLACQRMGITVVGMEQFDAIESLALIEK